MNWKLTNAAINGNPTIEDWSGWFPALEPKLSPKATIQRLKDLADVPGSGVIEVGEGRYLLKF